MDCGPALRFALASKDVAATYCTFVGNFYGINRCCRPRIYTSAAERTFKFGTRRLG